MKIEDLKVGRVYRAKRPRGFHRLDGSYVNDREILYYIYHRSEKVFSTTVLA